MAETVSESVYGADAADRLRGDRESEDEEAMIGTVTTTFCSHLRAGSIATSVTGGLNEVSQKASSD